MSPPETAAGNEGAAARPEVSVLIANYNNEPFLAEALGSVLDQGIEALEIIVVDDGSTDRSLDIVRDLQAKHPGRIRLFEQATKSGPGGARNRALAEARGQWLAVLDGDDLMQPGRLRSLIDQATAAGADIVADDLILFYQDGAKPPHRHLGEAWDGYGKPIDAAGYVAENHFYAKRPTLGYLKPVWRADRWRETGLLYDPSLRIGEDYDFMLRLLRRGLRFMVAPVAGYRYRRHAASISHRIADSQLAALLEADKRLVATLRPDETALAAVLRDRERSILDGLAFDAVVVALKAKNPVAAAKALLGRPRILPLLWEPVAVRIARMKASFRPQPSGGV